MLGKLFKKSEPIESPLPSLVEIRQDIDNASSVRKAFEAIDRHLSLAQRATKSKVPCVRGSVGMLITDIRCALMEFVTKEQGVTYGAVSADPKGSGYAPIPSAKPRREEEGEYPMPDPIRELPTGFLGSPEPIWEKVLLDYLENGVEPTDERIRAVTLRYVRDSAKKYLLLRYGDPAISAQWCAAEKVCRW